MNNHSQMSEDKIEQTRQKIYEIREVIWAYEEKKKDVHQAVEEICKIINSIPNIILDDELKKYCCSVFENAKKNPNLFSVIIKKILSVICLFLNPKENTKILKDTEHHIRLKKLLNAEDETNFVVHNRKPKTIKDKITHGLGNIKFSSY